MRGNDQKQDAMFSVSPEQEYQQSIRRELLRAMTDDILKEMSPRFGEALRGYGSTVDSAGTVVARPAAADILYSAQLSGCSWSN